MKSPVYNIANWKKASACAVAVIMMLANVALSSRYYIEINTVCIIALMAFLIPMIPQAFRQGCRQYAYTLIALVAVMTLPLIGTILFYLHSAPIA